MRWLVLPLLLGGCTSQFSLGPAAWTTVPPVIPGYHPVPIGAGNFVEAPDAPVATPEQTTLAALQEAQATRLVVRQLAR